MKKLKYFIPSLILMMIIFSFSSQTGTESSGLSSQIVLWIQNNLHISIPEIIIRKGAHMSEYALLTLTFVYGYHKSDITINKVYLYSIISCFLYACTDEMHQLFIGGRAGQFTDVLIDTSGGLIIIIIIYLITYRKKSH
ncbi:MAG: VanZ family protein [Coprobacillus sp.]